MLRNILASIILAFVATTLVAQEIGRQIVERDTIDYIYTPIDQSYDSSRSSGRLFRSLREEKPLAISILPIYSLETNLGIALMAQYNTSKFSASATAIASLSGYYNIQLGGANTFSHGHRLHYGAVVVSEPTRLWGLTFDTMLQNSYKTYTSKEYCVWLGYEMPIAKYLQLSVNVDYAYLLAARLDEGAQLLLGDMPLRASSVGIGVGLDYDSATSLSSYQKKGVCVKLSADYRPKILGNISGDIAAFASALDWYQPLWSGATFTFDVHGEHNTSKTPWLMQSSLGGGRLRGYYPGRYRGNSVAMAQVELRQHIWRGIGVVAWGGVGTVFSPADGSAWRKLLPTYGLGLRYYYQDIVLRADIGFGRNSYDILIGLGEAF
jgi:hypothetical protein